MITLLLLTFCAQSDFQIPKGLPDWANQALASMDYSKHPDADIWRILDETIVTRQKTGQWESQRRVLQIVLKQKGAEDAAIYTVSGDEKASKIRKLKGWHAHPQKGLDKLDKENVVTVGNYGSSTISSENQTLAFFEHVSKGSIIAFESIEQITPFFNLSTVTLLDTYPTKRLSIQLVDLGYSGQPVIEGKGLESWNIQNSMVSQRFEAWDLPGLETERLAPEAYDFYPYVMIGFLEAEQQGEPLQNWDSLAKWYVSIFMNKAHEKAYSGPAPTNLDQLYQDFRRKLRYQQVYLDNQRGWVPLSGAQVDQQAYGDCKDMVSCFAYRARALHLDVFPALANIGDDSPHTRAEDRASSAFNHVIAAISVPPDNALPATAEIGGKKYLLLDPTSPYTPLGFLPAYFQGRDVMLCLAEGAAWVKIPDAALEPSAIRWQLKGNLDAKRTFSGTIQAIATGGAYHLRAFFQQGGKPALLEAVRDVLNLPGYSDLSIKQAEIDSKGDLVFELSCNWPIFLRRDAEGFRLPSCIVSPGMVSLEPNRISPIWISAEENESWDLSLTSAIGIQFGADKVDYDDGSCSYHWQVKPSSGIDIHFQSQIRERAFDKQHLSEGLAFWKNFRKNYNQFSSDATFALLK